MDKKFICQECKSKPKFDSKNELERHQWQNHPKDEYQKAWSQISWSKYQGSSYYRDDPYY